MINLRFHIVSLVAVFLALAIGIAVGATVVDQGLVSQSQRRISSLDQTLQERASTIKKLRVEAAGAERFESDGEFRMVRSRLLSTPIVFVSDGTIDEPSIAEAVATLRASGARLVGTLDISGVVSVASDAEIERAKVAIAASSSRADTIRFLVRERMIGAIAKPFDTPSIGTLIDVGIVRARGFEGAAPTLPFPIGTRVVFLARATDDARGTDVAEILRRLAAAGAPTIVIGPADSFVVRRIRTVAALGSSISTIDDVGTTAGRIGAVYALEDLGRGIVGHYGTGEGAERLLPAA